MASTREIVRSILQYLDSVNLTETARTLERESGMFFNVTYFEQLFLEGRYEEAEFYLRGFTCVHDNEKSAKIFFEIRKHNFIETLFQGDITKAIKLVSEDFKVFEEFAGEWLAEATQLIPLEDIRMHQLMATYTDAAAERRAGMAEILKLLEANPVLAEKLVFPMPGVSTANAGASDSGSVNVDESEMSTDSSSSGSSNTPTPGSKLDSGTASSSDTFSSETSPSAGDDENGGL